MGSTLPPRPCGQGDIRSECRRGSVNPSRRTTRSVPAPPAAARPKADCGGAHRVTPPSGFDRPRPPCSVAYSRTRHSSLHGSFPEFSPLRRTRHAEATFTSAGHATPDYAPSPGFRTLLTVSLLRAPSGLVSSRWRPWGSLFGALLPRDEPLRLSTLRALLTLAPGPLSAILRDVPSSPTMVCDAVTPFRSAVARALAFRALLPSASRDPRARRFSRTHGSVAPLSFSSPGTAPRA